LFEVVVAAEGIVDALHLRVFSLELYTDLSAVLRVET